MKRLTSYQVAFFLLGLALCQYGFFGYHFGEIGSDHALEIPLLKIMANSAIYPDDFLRDVIPFHMTFFFRFMALLSRWINLELLFFTFHLLSTFGILFMGYRLSLYIFESQEKALLTAVLFLLADFRFFCGLSIIDPSLSHSHFAFPFILFSFLLFLQGRYTASFLWLGLIGNFHLLLSIFAFLIFCVYLILKWKEVDARSVGKALIVFFLAALPVGVWYLILQGFPSSNAEDFIKLMRFRSPISFPFGIEILRSEGLFIWIKYMCSVYGSLFFFSAVFLYIIHLHRPSTLLQGKAVFLLKLCGFIPLCMTVVVAIFPQATLLRLGPERGFVYWGVLGIVFLSNYIIERGKKGWLSGVLPCAGSFHYLLLPFLFLMCIFNRHKRLTLLLLVVSCLPLAYLTAKLVFSGILGYNSIGTFETMDKVRLSLLGVVILGTAAFKEDIFKKGINLIFFFVAVGFLFYLCLSEVVFRRDPLEQSYREVQVWAKVNTPQEAVFITPPYLSGFRVFSEREEVVTYKDGAVALFNTELALRWWQRMKDFGGYEEDGRLKIKDLKVSYNSFTTEDFLVLANQYNAGYALVERIKILNLPEVYSNKGFRLYSITP